MAHNNVTEQLLRRLRPYGVGYYTDISTIIRNAFPPQTSDHTDEIYEQRIRDYLDNLERDGYIKCNNVIITRPSIYIEAAILDAGVNHIRPVEKSRLYRTVEFIFWIAGIGVLLFMVYEHFRPGGGAR
jgi:hypothetical protein